ncbi:LysR family transcriptional regulator [Pelomonas sp. CA6]|uniref:LysR family transcriptional regulator n=1 Tax=Pelomonas sp. CA6 TaxID=2907999 RepID=UPI001F4C3B17|nr:LysR family transcriptional regulator [Pelomonas sp. CA6]MCH7343114.1 LysR family transcriptional regulator [Pelomonas sp. CA6]
MEKDDLPDLLAFWVIAQEHSFRGAARRLGMSPSALSHTMRRLENRLGVALLLRTTRSVAPTPAGVRLLDRLQPAFESIDGGLLELAGQSERVAGLLRLNVHRSAAESLILPRLAALQRTYPDLRVELRIDDGTSDVVASGCDAGVRNGELLDKDMVAVRISGDQSSVVVGSPDYLRGAPPLATPEDLKHHRCIGYRFNTAGTVHRWRFAQSGRMFEVGVPHALVVDDVHVARSAAREGVGLCYLLRGSAAGLLQSGELVEVLPDWTVVYPGDYLYYPSRRTVTPALRVLVEHLRYRAPGAEKLA